MVAIATSYRRNVSSGFSEVNTSGAGPWIERHVERHVFAVAHDLHLDDVAHLLAVDVVRELLVVVRRVAVDADDHVASAAAAVEPALQTGAFGGRAGLHRLNQYALIDAESEALRHRGRHVHQRNAETWVLHRG